MKTLREAQETIKDHLLEQGKRAWNSLEASCMYRAPGGLKCAVGCLIDDKYFHESWNWKAVTSTLVRRALKLSGWPTDDDALRVYGKWQFRHDLRSNWDDETGYVGPTDLIDP